METMQKVFLTGGTGFIGTRLLQALIDRGHVVRVLSRRADPTPPPRIDGPEGRPWRHERVELVRGEIGDRGCLVRAMEGCSHVFHLAAYAKNWARDPETFLDVNVQGMRNVFDAAAESRVQRVVWTSTVMTFGPTPPGVVGNEDMPRITEHYYSQYERSKTIAEGEALRRAREGFPVVIVNPTRVYGPGHLTEGNALSAVIDDYDRGRLPFLLNRGVNVANYVLVDDVAEGHILAMEYGRVGQRYILGGENASLNELFRIVDQVSGKRHRQLPVFKMLPLLFAAVQEKRAEWFDVYPQITPGWMRTLLADWAYSCEKAQRELGYRPTPLLEGIRTTYQWLQRLRGKPP
jgi:nucleoside-diphosphate-sugar epimerase